MISRVSPGWFAAMLVVSSCLVSVPVCAQSLSLSYKLDVSSVHLQRVSISNDTCAGVSWVATVATCARADALGRFSWSAPADEEGTRSQPVGAEKAAAVVPQPSEASELARAGRELTLGLAASSSSTEAHLRPAAAREDPAASLKPDVTLRLASKKKARSADDEVNYSDAALQNRSQKNNFNSLGVELLIPFH